MKQYFAKCILWMILMAAGKHVSSQITITGNLTGEQLASYLAGPGVEISNVTYSFRSVQAGRFRNNTANSNLKIDSGIVLTTGRAFTDRLEIGVDSDPSETANNPLNQAGDQDIDRVLSQFVPGIRSDNACVLEFDFIPTGDTVRFNYVFGSDEYPDYNCTLFADLFLFYISGQGINGKENMALIPGTNIPVTINSINDGTVSPDGDRTFCSQLGAGSPFIQYYVDNQAGPNIVYNGLTRTLEAKHVVVPCRRYHLKIVIADVNDAEYDSGVFLQAGSLTSDYAKLDYAGDVSNGYPALYEGCDTATISVRYFKKVDAPKTVRLYTAGTADNFSDFDLKVPPTVIIPAGDSVVTFPLRALQENFTEGDEQLIIYVAANPCNVNDPIYTDSILVTVHEYKKITVLPPIAGICPGQSMQLDVLNPAQFMGGFSWIPAASLNDATIYNPVASPDTSTNYQVSSNFSASCKGRGFSYVQIKDPSSITITKTDVSCFGNNGTITVEPGVTWVFPTFSLDNGPFSNNNTFTGLAPGTYTITIVDATNCRAVKTVTIVQLQNVSATVSVTPASCNGTGGGVVIHAQAGLAPYEYSLNGFMYTTDSVFTNVNAGPLTAYVKDASGCPFTLPFVLGFDPPINFTWAVTPDSCRGLPDGTITINAAGGSGTGFEYSADGGANFQPGSMIAVAAGVHTVIVRDDKGCSSQLDITVPLNNTVTVNAGRDTTICEGDVAVLLATSNATSFTWTPAAGLNFDNVLRPAASPAVSTRYTITVTSGLCTRTDEVDITVNPAPVADAGPDARICFGQTAQLTGSGAGNYTWFPNQHISNRYIANPVVAPRTTTRYWLHVTDANGCRSITADTAVITVIPPMRVFAGADTIVAANQPLQLNATATVTGAAFNWSPSLGLSNAGIANPIAVLQNHQRYIVTATMPEGCSGKDTIDIKVYTGPEIYVAGAFTPNNDGVNDRIMAVPAGIKTFQYFRVYNRWGNLVFSTTNFRDGWDGRLRGTEQGPDTYMWTARGIDYNGNIVTRKGSVVLVK